MAQNRAGGNGMFLPGAVNATIPKDWTELPGKIGPAQWRPGTAYVRVVAQGMRPGAGALLMDDFALRLVK